MGSLPACGLRTEGTFPSPACRQLCQAPLLSCLLGLCPLGTSRSDSIWVVMFRCLGFSDAVPSYPRPKAHVKRRRTCLNRLSVWRERVIAKGELNAVGLLTAQRANNLSGGALVSAQSLVLALRRWRGCFGTTWLVLNVRDSIMPDNMCEPGDGPALQRRRHRSTKSPTPNVKCC